MSGSGGCEARLSEGADSAANASSEQGGSDAGAGAEVGSNTDGSDGATKSCAKFGDAGDSEASIAPTDEKAERGAQNLPNDANEKQNGDEELKRRGPRKRGSFSLKSLRKGGQYLTYPKSSTSSHKHDYTDPAAEGESGTNADSGSGSSGSVDSSGSSQRAPRGLFSSLHNSLSRSSHKNKDSGTNLSEASSSSASCASNFPRLTIEARTLSGQNGTSGTWVSPSSSSSSASSGSSSLSGTRSPRVNSPSRNSRSTHSLGALSSGRRGHHIHPGHSASLGSTPRNRLHTSGKHGPIDSNPCPSPRFQQVYDQAKMRESLVNTLDSVVILVQEASSCSAANNASTRGLLAVRGAGVCGDGTDSSVDLGNCAYERALNAASRRALEICRAGTTNACNNDTNRDGDDEIDDGVKDDVISSEIASLRSENTALRQDVDAAREKQEKAEARILELETKLRSLQGTKRSAKEHLAASKQCLTVGWSSCINAVSRGRLGNKHKDKDTSSQDQETVDAGREPRI